MSSKSKLFLATFFLGLILVPMFAQAALVECGTREKDDPTPNTIEGECRLIDLVILLFRLINTLLSYSGLFAVFFVFWAGWNYIFAGGDAESIASAKDTLFNAILGFFLVLIAYLLISVVIEVFTEGGNVETYFKFLPLGQ